MNYTEFLKSITTPDYQIEGKEPKCKRGYKWDKNIGGCVPIGAKFEDKKSNNQNEVDGYNIIGSTGMDGGYALEDGVRNAPWNSSI